MMSMRRFGNFVARYRAFASAIIVVLPFILAACTNGGGSGPGY